MSAVINAARLIAIAACSGAAFVGSTTNGAAQPPSAQPGTLMGILPQGYSSVNCQEATPKGNVLETVECNANSDPAGPGPAFFALFGNVGDLTADFQNAQSTVMTVASSCPGGLASPGSWSYGTSGQTAGQVVCGTDSNNTVPLVAWTNNAKLMLGVISGTITLGAPPSAGLPSLYQWWSSNSG